MLGLLLSLVSTAFAKEPDPSDFPLVARVASVQPDAYGFVRAYIVVNDTKYFGLTTNGFRLAPPVSMGDEYAARFGKWHGHEGVELLTVRDGKRKAVFFTFIKERSKSTLPTTPNEN